MYINYGDPYIPAPNALEPIKSKQCINILDAIYGVHEGGPYGGPTFVANKILMSQGIFAVDYLGREMLEEQGGRTVSRASHIDSAADYGIGTNDPTKMEIIGITDPSGESTTTTIPASSGVKLCRVAVVEDETASVRGGIELIIEEAAMIGRRTMKAIGYSLLAVILCLGCSKSSTTGTDDVLSIEDLMVQNNEISGWSYSGSGWVATSISELTEYINGLAETYQEHGFEEGAQQSYVGTIDGDSRIIQLMVFDMGTESNAKDTYDDPDLGLSGATVWTDGAGTESHYVRYSGLSEAMAFYKKKYFVHLQVNYDSDETLNILKQFALNVDGKIE